MSLLASPTDAELAAGPVRPRRALFRLALTSGDERLAILPQTGRNRYGIPPGPAPSETWFASSTASPISPRGHEAATLAFERVLGQGPVLRLEQWPETIRQRLLALFGVPGSAAILTGSGTEAELVVLALARHLLVRPITNIVIAPGETGSGVRLAAAGRHFLDSASCAPEVARGELLRGLERDAVAVDAVEIRSAVGDRLDAEDVDASVLAGVEAALAAGRDVIAHCLDASKTGLTGLRRSTARILGQALKARGLVVVDACQARCSAEQIKADLRAGFIVVTTGSKFAGGPPFSGVVLVPPDLVARLGSLALPDGLSAYSAWHDWPIQLRDAIGGGLTTAFNLGLYLRWEAALAELERYAAVEPQLRSSIIERFGSLVRDVAGRAPGLSLLPAQDDGGSSAQPTIFPIVTRGLNGKVLEARTIFDALDRQGLHVGQPVSVGPATVLRICLAAPQIVDVADRAAAGLDLDAAMSPLRANLEKLIGAWSDIRMCHRGEPRRAMARA